MARSGGHPGEGGHRRDLGRGLSASSRSAVLYRVGAFTIRRRRPVLLAAAVFAVVFAAFGLGVTKHLSQGGFDAPGSQSARASAVLAHEFHTGSDNLVLVVHATNGTVDSPPVAAAGTALTRRLASERYVANVESYWSLGHPGKLQAAGGRRALIVARIVGDENQMVAREPAVVAPLTHVRGPVRVAVGGFAPTFHEVDRLVERGLLTAELIAVPLTFLLLLFFYGSMVAAALPLVVGAFSVLGTLFVLRALSAVTSVSVFSENLTTALGLGLAIDYSLFMVSRFREELAAGADTDEAVRRTVARAGRTITGSSLTVAGSLAVLLVFPMVFLRSFAYAGIPVALLSGAGAVLVLPAVLGALGGRVNALTVWKRSLRPGDDGLWSRVARAVMRRPVVFLVGTVALLGVLGSPFLGLKLGYLDYRVLPPADHVRQVNDLASQQFGRGQAEPLNVVVPEVGVAQGSPARAHLVDDYAARLSRLPGAATVSAETGVFVHGVRLPAPRQYLAPFSNPEGTWLSVEPSVDAVTPRGEGIVRDVRDTPAPFKVLVGGMPAENVDATHGILARLPLALALIALVSFMVLLLMFRSVLIPAKALVLNVLSLAATFGAMVWVFQEGHLSSLLGFTATGSLIATMPLLMFCVAFGLSMDYEVFLISRIKEQHDLGADNTTAVATGLQRTGRIVSAASLTMTVVFLALMTSGISFIKLFGLGLTIAVLIDAFVVRGMLVPAFMRIAGDANWWMPRIPRAVTSPLLPSATFPLVPAADPPDDRDRVPAPLGPELSSDDTSAGTVFVPATGTDGGATDARGVRCAQETADRAN